MASFKSCLKVSFVAITVTYAVIALIIAAGTIWYSIKLKEITDLRDPYVVQVDLTLRLPQYLAFIFVPIGTFALLVMLCGVCGVSNRAVLIVYCIFSTIVLILLIGATVMTMVKHKDDTQDFFRQTLHNVFFQMNSRPEVKERYKELEMSLKCCGADGPENYKTALPSHCVTRGSTHLSPMNGCIKIVTTYTDWAVYGLVATSGVVGILCFSSIVIACVLICLRRDSEKA